MNYGEQGYVELQVSTITTTTNFVIEDTHALYILLPGRMAKSRTLTGMKMLFQNGILLNVNFRALS